MANIQIKTEKVIPFGRFFSVHRAIRLHILYYYVTTSGLAHAKHELKVASLFCGCGGSDLGMVGGFDYLGKSIAHGELNEEEIKEYMSKNPEGSFCPVKEKKPIQRYKQLDFLDLFDTYQDGEIVDNSMVPICSCLKQALLLYALFKM
ncbi:MAG: hypothetical protein Q4E55_06010 [Bacteroidales bacterium]|nr:hypothetical protein [Bacteroidales bacterium]